MKKYCTKIKIKTYLQRHRFIKAQHFPNKSFILFKILKICNPKICLLTIFHKKNYINVSSTLFFNNCKN